MAKPITFADTIAASVDQLPSGFNVSITQDYAYDDTDAVPTIFLNDPESTSLQKRSQRPDECWAWATRYPGASLPSRYDYETALAEVIDYLRNQGDGFWSIKHGQKASVFSSKLTVVVRNQSYCKDIKIKKSTVAYYVQQISDFCHERKQDL
ncbi:hypothetical protein LTR10_001716 [Elasticomyces elasticus]|nr:hypothetical protein LTR10_001716 [Elasticomyces elasticus]KAK4975216.1 hypothetical protein LTR42_004426 [Elasticomyces elasticus]